MNDVKLELFIMHRSILINYYHRQVYSHFDYIDRIDVFSVLFTPIRIWINSCVGNYE